MINTETNVENPYLTESTQSLVNIYRNEQLEE